MNILTCKKILRNYGDDIPCKNEDKTEQSPVQQQGCVLPYIG